MGCNCKKKPVIDRVTAFELIKKGIIDGEKLSQNEMYKLYDFYDTTYNQNTSKSCLDCFNSFIKDKLIEYYNKQINK